MEKPAETDDLWTVEQAAFYVRSTPSTLATLRSRGGGPAFYKGLGRKVLYRREDLDRFIASRRVDCGTQSSEVAVVRKDGDACEQL